MKRLKFYISIAVVSITLFSCKNHKEWTPENEKEFKESFQAEVQKDGSLNEEDAKFTADCIVEKAKEKNLSPDDLEKPENEAVFVEIVTKCTLESQKK